MEDLARHPPPFVSDDCRATSHPATQLPTHLRRHLCALRCLALRRQLLLALLQVGRQLAKVGLEDVAHLKGGREWIGGAGSRGAGEGMEGKG